MGIGDGNKKGRVGKACGGKEIDSRYQPTKVELEADLSLPEGVTPEEVVRAMFSGDPPRVESGKGKPSTEK